MMDFGFSEDQVALQDTVRKLMARHAPPEYVRQLDANPDFPTTLYKAWAEAGLLGVPFPAEYGGFGGNALDLVCVAENISYTSNDYYMAFGGSVFCGLNILRKGSQDQKAYWLPKLLAGEIKMSVAMSEADAGSDVGAMRTTAHRDGDQWVINGEKLWATSAGTADNVINVYARTQPDGDYRKGISLFLVDNDTPGLTLRRQRMLGRRCVGTYEAVFENVRVPADRLVGGENMGWSCLLSGLQLERVCLAAGNCGAAQGAFDIALDHAKSRRQFGRTIGAFQAIAHMLADMQIESEAARTMSEISMAKVLASEAYVNVTNKGMHIMGASGYSMEFDMQRHFRDARMTTVGGGTSEIQRNLIARKLGLEVA
jgi:alkylation response protein AidB-like acyl-CoA dehydrogenase